MNDEPKAERVSVSMPSALVRAMEAHVDAEHGENVSAYVRRLVAADLAQKGLLPQPNDPRQQLLAMVDAALEQGRAGEALAALTGITAA